jgi:predicted nucleic acid-binding protein
VIVLDSSFLIAFHNPSDAHHRAASVLMERFLAGEWGKGLLLEYTATATTAELQICRTRR